MAVVEPLGGAFEASPLVAGVLPSVPLVLGVLAWEGMVYATREQERHSLVVEAQHKGAWACTRMVAVNWVQVAPT